MLNAKANKAGNIFTSNFLDKCVTQVKKLITMINGFLNVSRLEAGKLSIDLKYFDMSLLMKEVKEEIDVIIKSYLHLLKNLLLPHIGIKL